MIFATVGSLRPFTRFMRALDEWACVYPEERVFAQTGLGSFVPRHMSFAGICSPKSYLERMQTASIVVAHAGIGSLIAAREAGKPIVICPRRQALGEHESDHQVDTARWLKGQDGVFVAMSETDLWVQIGKARAYSRSVSPQSYTTPMFFAERLREAIAA
jgi:UDP-N-acetylglucosamine transferase subunit ALG13